MAFLHMQYLAFSDLELSQPVLLNIDDDLKVLNDYIRLFI